MHNRKIHPAILSWGETFPGNCITFPGFLRLKQTNPQDIPETPRSQCNITDLLKLTNSSYMRTTFLVAQLLLCRHRQQHFMWGLIITEALPVLLQRYGTSGFQETLSVSQGRDLTVLLSKHLPKLLTGCFLGDSDHKYALESQRARRAMSYAANKW